MKLYRCYICYEQFFFSEAKYKVHIQACAKKALKKAGW